MVKLTVLHTNDLHGRVEQLARISTLVSEIRQQTNADGRTCFYFDCGDCEDTRLIESTLTKGASMDALLHAAGCDAVALGNAVPIRYGYQAIADLAKAFSKPILCANLLDENSQTIAGLQPYRIIKVGGIQIGLIGLTANITSYAGIFHIHNPEPKTILPELIAKIRAKGVKTIFLLSHLSSTVDVELARSIPGIDLILGGHDHKVLYPPIEESGCIVAQTGQYGEHLGRLDLEIDSVSGKIVHYQARLLDVNSELQMNENVLQALEREKERAQEMMKTVIGRVKQPLEVIRDGECSAGNLVADALLEHYPQAHCALALAGHWLSTLPEGEISQGGLFSACRSTANPCLVELKGEQIIHFLQTALSPGNYDKVIERQLRGGFVGFPHVAGLKLKWDGYDPTTLHVWMGDQLLHPEQTYLVAATDMELSDFIGYLALPDDVVNYEVPTIVPEILQDYISRHSPILKIPDHRLTLL